MPRRGKGVPGVVIPDATASTDQTPGQAGCVPAPPVTPGIETFLCEDMTWRRSPAYLDVSITAAEMKAIRATPKSLVAAPGAGKFLEFISLTLFLDYGTAVYVIAAAGDDLRVRYIDGAGVAASGIIETTGFLDQAGDMAIVALPDSPPTPKTKAQVENRALVLHNVGANEFTAGDSPVRAKVVYRVHATGW